MNDDKFADYDLVDIKNKKQPESALLADALTILLRYKFLFAFCLIASCTLGYVYIRTTPKMFMRTATIMVKDTQKGTGLMESQTFNDVLTLGSNSVANETGILKSRRLMYKVTERLKLNVSYRALNLKKTELYSSSPIKVHFMNENEECSMVVKLAGNDVIELSEINDNRISAINVTVGKITNTPIGKIYIEMDSIGKAENKGMEILVSNAPLKITANAFCNRLNVGANETQSSLLNLSIVDENPQRAEDVLNTLIDVYNQDAIDDKNKVTINTANFIDERLSIIEKGLGLVDSEIEEYKKQNRLTDLSSESDVFLNNSNKLDNDGLSIENQLNMVEYMKAYLLRNGKDTEMIPGSIGIQDNGILKQITDYNEIVAKRNKLLANSSERNPLVKDMDATLKLQRNSIVRAIDNLQTSLKLQSMNMKSKEQETYDKITSLPTQQKQIVSIERQQKIKEELYLYLLNKKEENELQQTIAESNCKIVDVADGPSSPVSPNKIQVILICLIAGFSIPSLLLYLRMLLNTKVYLKEDIKDKVSIPFLGEVPFDKVSEEKDIRISEDSAHEHLNEALKIVRENLNFINGKQDEKGKTVQLISFNPSSGKTFITINLAVNIASSNAKVIALDLDLRKASLSKRLGFSTKQEGISNYLSGDANNIQTLIHTVNADNLSFDVISSGVIPPNPSELLKDTRLDKLMEFLKQEYDYVLFDNPPYGLLVDAFVCSRLADHSIYVIRSGMFDKRLLPDLQELYDSNKLKHLSIILNGVDYKKMAYSYKYGYSYHYHHYKKQHEKQRGWKNLYSKLFGDKY
ncbi:polysaccharide biosynthesis tyrosine autokinase [uncultured Bacteroides sp.]|uniref:GumC family protein n=1 Tax=uncultured Bacteroides sp. TaxID=162156 RepID=UPI002AA6C6D6|nr:polysaccharide biosynthesis tyrosine autokinase [uncultured Bacteroides sp.]